MVQVVTVFTLKKISLKFHNYEQNKTKYDSFGSYTKLLQNINKTKKREKKDLCSSLHKTLASCSLPKYTLA